MTNEMTNEEKAIEQLERISEHLSAIGEKEDYTDIAIQALEAQPSEDCISILNRIMEYTYGMLTAEKIGLQHLIKSMMDEMSGGGEDGVSD